MRAKTLLKPLLITVSILCLCSCTENNDEMVQGNAMTIAHDNDPICLPTCLIWDNQNVSANSIPIVGTRAVTATDDHGYFTFIQKPDGNGGSKLIPTLRQGVTLPERCLDEVTIKTNSGNQSKLLKIVLRNTGDTIKRVMRGPSSTDNAVKARFAYCFAHAINPNIDIVGAVKVYPVLQENALQNLITLNNCRGEVEYHQEHGSDIREISDSHNYNFGLGGTYTNVFTGNLGVNYKSENKNHSEYEYITGTKTYTCRQGALQWNNMELKKNGIVSLTYIDENFNKVLNDPTSPQYQRYEDTYEGIARLLKEYGSQLVCTATLGAYAEYRYSRKKSIAENSIAWDLKLSLSYTHKADSIPGSLLTNLRKLRELGINVTANTTDANNALKKGTIEGSFGTEQKFTDYLESNNTSIDVTMKGGSALVAGTDNISQFNATDDCSNWIITSYTYGTSEDAQYNPQAFHSITELCGDTVTPNGRGRIIADLLAPIKMEDGRTTCKFYRDYFEQPKEEEPTPIVVADFCCISTPAAHNQVPNSGDPKPLVMEGPDGKKRTYYALMTSPYSNHKNMQGYVFESSWHHNFVQTTLNYWYYALDYVDQFDTSKAKGIVDVQIHHPSDIAKGYIQRGDNTSKGIWGCTRDRYIYVKPGNADTKNSDLITAVGIFDAEKYESREKGNGHEIFASTGGAELAVNATEAEKADFARMWNGNTVPYDYPTNMKNLTRNGQEIVKFHNSDHLYAGGWITRSPILDICWSKMPLQRKMTFTYEKDKGYVPSGIHQPLSWK